MQYSFAAIAITALTLTSSVSSLNILLGNDDGFASAQIRETYRLLKEKGHTVVIVSEADNESGQGGRSVFTSDPTLPNGSEFGIIPPGAPSIGTDPNDHNIWQVQSYAATSSTSNMRRYYNGTPAATAFVAFDYVLPNFAPFKKPDLVVAGPNFGNNLGTFFYTLSGTAGYTYNSIGRGYPGIMFSGGNSEQRSFEWINKTTPSGFPDPATIQAQLAVDIVETLVKNSKPGERLMPLGYGISVNTPVITSLTNDSCVNPPFVQTRLTGGADYDQALFNKTSGLFTFQNIVPPGGNVCYHGDCSLPGETVIVNSGCFSSVSVFTVDYDASIGPVQTSIRSRLEPLVKFQGKSSGKGGFPTHHWTGRYARGMK
ncbi:5'/3'-nucleotidase sure [Rhizodiscina lignyota]|uniref:5'/3'-nucleotidase sure n=1 Tax=Rhizodiscina lignyota TaxID=1504668 RepID=A0A9P4MBI7_9PEZI|nr:5'/3'-nucleotidase sure [Rhizodiscina lignyota]